MTSLVNRRVDVVGDVANADRGHLVPPPYMLSPRTVYIKDSLSSAVSSPDARGALQRAGVRGAGTEPAVRLPAGTARHPRASALRRAPRPTRAPSPALRATQPPRRLRGPVP